MEKLEIGMVFTFNNSDTKYVYYGKSFREWYNTGGMGEYTYYYIKLEDLLKLENVKDTEELNKYIEESKKQKFNSCITIDKTEAPFEITSRQAVLYSIRRKKPRTITIYE